MPFQNLRRGGWATCGLTAVVVLLAAVGCGEEEAPVGEVMGKVAVEGEALEEGYVNFEDPARGIGMSAEIKNGAYRFPNPIDVGQYKVYIQPLSMAPTAVSPTGPPKGPIPIQYLYAGSSPLEADVVAGQNTIDFDLKKQ